MASTIKLIEVILTITVRTVSAIKVPMITFFDIGSELILKLKCILEYSSTVNLDTADFPGSIVLNTIMVHKPEYCEWYLLCCSQ
jgi:hypothetical protein